MTHKWMLPHTLGRLATFATLATLGGLCLLSSCTIQQQRDVLGTIGTVIPGSSTSRIPSLYSSSSPSSASPSAPSNPSAATPSSSSAITAAVTPSPPKPGPPPETVDIGRTDAQWVLQTLQNAMGNDPAPFQECLDNTPCKTALSAHLIQLQKRAGGTLELPAVYDRYDLERGKE